MHYNHRQPSSTANKPPPLSVSISTTTQPNSSESPHSPLRSNSPLQSDDPHSPTSSPLSKILSIEKYYSPLTSPLPTTPPDDAATPDSFPPVVSHHHHVISLNRREETQPGVVYGGGERKGRVGILEKEALGLGLGLGVRVLEFVFCLVSFSIMASSKTEGWSGDSFDRHREYRFCLTVTILGFVYSGFQTYDLSYHLRTGKHVITHHLRHQFEFISDQIIAYLLMSAASAAATRVNDWQVNWGKDEFTNKISASVSMAFLAFFAFAISSLISGYNLLNRHLS